MIQLYYIQSLAAAIVTNFSRNGIFKITVILPGYDSLEISVNSADEPAN